MTRVAVYARVSTDRQHEELQLQELERHVAAKPGWILFGVFTDIVSSKKYRPNLQRLWSEAKLRKFDLVLVWRFDRFARSTVELANALQNFNALGIDFVSLHEGIDTSTPAGKLAFHIFASIAEFERDLIGQRVKAGMELARSQGRKFGRPSVDLDPSEVVRLRSAGYSWGAISRELGRKVSLCRKRYKEAMYKGSSASLQPTPLVSADESAGS